MMDRTLPDWVEALRHSLQGAASPPDEAVLETHISWVILAGEYAYKIKKPIKLDFLDFSTLDKRHHYCDEELRLNGRFAPQLYLDVLPIRRDAHAIHVGATGAIIDYAVRMRRFSQSALASQCIVANTLETPHVEAFAVRLAGLHQNAERVARGSPYGAVESIHAAALDNFSTLAALPGIDAQGARDDQCRLAELREWTMRQSHALWPQFTERQNSGQSRECHGDLHLGNLVLLEGTLVPFDCLEFDPGLRWIDVMSEVAFLMMDMQDHGRVDLAWHFLNAYLETSNGYDGLGVLRFYLVYRAMVRAKVHALRAKQPGLTADESSRLINSVHDYLALATSYTQSGQPRLILMHGLSGSGKSAVAHAVAGRLNAVHLRSDVERKRLVGLSPQQSSGSDINVGIYTTQHTHAVYARLADLARLALRAGWSVVVDATFLQRVQRNQFRTLAKTLTASVVIINPTAPEEQLRARIDQRGAGGQDASEANQAVLTGQLSMCEPLTVEELRNTIPIDTTQGTAEAAARQALLALHAWQDTVI